MDQEYFAFYWTFPVPWAGFHRLPAEIEDENFLVSHGGNP